MAYDLPGAFVQAGLAVEAAAALASLALAFTILYAGSAGDYFQAPRTRWEWGGIGGRPCALAALCLAGIAVLVLVVGWRRDTSVVARVSGLLTAAAAFGLLAVVWLALTIGH